MKEPKKKFALNLKHLTSTYPLESIVVKDSQIEWDDHLKPRKLPCKRFDDGRKFNMHFEAT
jgi:hypothetical protein